MAFLIFFKNDVELGRWQLPGPTVIGRSPECEVSVHDILLSRRHCRIQPSGGKWLVIDLNSKNGTRVNRERVDRRGLRDGDVLTVGRTTVRFQMGKLAGGATPPPTRMGKRPADPFEALAGTVSDFDAEAAAAYQRRLNLPTPRPRPPEPSAFAREDLYSVLTEIASSSWDSIYAGASRPRRPLPERAGPVTVARLRRPVHPQADVSLHAPATSARTDPARTQVRRADVAHPPATPRPGWVRRAVRSATAKLRAVRQWVAL